MFEAAVISSRPYGLMSVREAFHSWLGAHRSMPRPARSGTEHQVCGHITAPGPGLCGISLCLRAPRSTVSTTVWSLLSTGGDLQWLQVLLGCQRHRLFWWLGTRTGSVASRSQCCAHTQRWGTASGTSAVAGARCRHGWQRGPLIAAGASAVSMLFHACTLCCRSCTLQYRLLVGFRAESRQTHSRRVWLASR